jgi:hypothetical protein
MDIETQKTRNKHKKPEKKVHRLIILKNASAVRPVTGVLYGKKVSKTKGQYASPQTVRITIFLVSNCMRDTDYGIHCNNYNMCQPQQVC